MKDVLSTYLEMTALHKASMQHLVRLRGSLAGQTVFCLGTGPSLNRTDLAPLAGRPVIFLNNAFRLAPDVRPSHPVFLCTDFLRLREIRPEIVPMQGLKVCSSDRVMMPRLPVDLYAQPFNFVMPKLAWVVDRKQVRPKVILHGFSDDLAQGLYLGHSVVFSAIQLAAYLGATRIALVGIDMDYTSPGGSYFDPTVRDNWSRFNYDTEGRDHFVLVRDTLLNKGVTLVNSTVGGRIDVLPRLPLGDFSVSHPSTG
jgi:hypothetical protein